MADLDGPYDVPCGSGDGDDAAAADTTDQEAATTDADLRLPPLPPPLKTRNLEFCCGATTILTCVAVAAGVAVAVIFAPSSNLSPTAKIVCAVLVGVECLVAIISLLVIGFGDPGIVKRTPASTNPIPKDVAERLRAGEGLDGLQNFVDESRGVYCVKCCVWRPRNAVHCTTCIPVWNQMSGAPRHRRDIATAAAHRLIDFHTGVDGAVATTTTTAAFTDGASRRRTSPTSSPSARPDGQRLLLVLFSRRSR